MASKRGRGCIYQRGEIWWVKYSVHGKSYLESSKSTHEADAKRLLKKRLGEIASENNVRTGFFEPEEFLLLRLALPDYLTGWRKEEILGLRWQQIDREAGILRIDPEMTKSKEGRILFLEGELKEVIEFQWKTRYINSPYVFHRKGKRIKDFRRAWNTAL